MVFATAMAAVSGTVILLAFRNQKISSPTQFPHRASRSCISSDGKKKEKKKKRVHFAEDVVDPSGNSEEFRKKHSVIISSKSSASSSSRLNKSNFNGSKVRGMPENRVALYNGILRDRVQRVAYSY